MGQEQNLDWDTDPRILDSSTPVPFFGWTRVALALRPMWNAEDEVIRVEMDGYAPLLIDTDADAFWWETSPADMPLELENVRITREPRGDSSLVSDAPGRELASLLWYIGLNSFPNELAWWLQRGDRYRLSRWPNFTTIDHTADQVRMTSLLGYAHLTVDDLAVQSNVDPVEARRLINAFSLMRILRAESPELALPRPALLRVTPAPTPAAATAPRLGLFRRLRERLGR